jgi:hypothetical protein
MAEVWEERAADWLAWVRTPGKDASRAVVEAARVLTGSGHLCVCVTHPFAGAGDWGEDGRFVVTRPDLQGGPFHVSVEREGLRMEVDGFAHSLERYARAVQDAGLVIESVREPSGDARWAQLPMFLMLRCCKR